MATGKCDSSDPRAGQRSATFAANRTRSRLPRLLTVRETADVLQVSERHVRRLIADCAFSVYRPSPGTIRISEDDLLRYLEQVRG